MILELEFILQSIGVIGVVVFYVVLSKLSARMGEGLKLAPYYKLDYVACIIISLTIPIHAYLHQKYEPHSMEYLDLQGLYILLLLISNVIVIIVSFRYWWWLKDEILKERGN